MTWIVIGALALGSLAGWGIGYNQGRESTWRYITGLASREADWTRERAVLRAQLAEHEAWQTASATLGLDSMGRLRS